MELRKGSQSVHEVWQVLPVDCVTLGGVRVDWESRSNEHGGEKV